MTKRKRKGQPAFKARYLVITGILAVILLAAFGDKGLFDVLRLKAELEGISRQNTALSLENRELEKKIGLLKTDNRYIEHIAKTELGMIRRDEVQYRFEDAE